MDTALITTNPPRLKQVKLSFGMQSMDVETVSKVYGETRDDDKQRSHKGRGRPTGGTAQRDDRFILARLTTMTHSTALPADVDAQEETKTYHRTKHAITAATRTHLAFQPDSKLLRLKTTIQSIRRFSALEEANPMSLQAGHRA
ncbi:Alanyl-tRNA editing protein AlaX-L [Tolypocladium paradoxum]|uniref:Alanyl-tRNA editing protein AlaX-L n=1 Tax=Tolypocladium paradoxum TaxID=94208 RepID=A0A2S4KS37_9HYPO|nr:Alanyl-tRNA editing protein AlaX-L [Tolypocladium paradoxum]